MSNKLSKRDRASRAAVAAILALLFAGSAAVTAATALGLAIPALPLYFAAGAAAGLCVLGAVSGGGAVLAAILFVAAAGAYAAANVAGLGAVRALFAGWSGAAMEPERALLGGRTLLTCGAFVFAALFFALLNRRESVSLAVMLLLALLVACHALSATASLGAAAPGLVAAAAAFALTGGVQRDMSALRALVPATLAVALALTALPAGRVTWSPMEHAAERVRAVAEQYFNFTRQRVAFSISEQGYDHAGEVGDSVISMLGGPAQPHTDPVLRVRTDADALLRGAIRTAYTGYSWVDAAPKSRYLYYDLTHKSIRDRVFTPPAALEDALDAADVEVELLDEGTGTLFVPGFLEKFSMELSTAVYYNTAGEMFLSRDVAPGDSYTLRALLPEHGDALREAVLRGETLNDDRYQDILALHSQLPEGVEGGVYALTMQVTEGADNPYDRAVAIMDYLRRNMRYTLTPEYPPQGRDFVSYFVLEGKRGYCSYYASAMAVMGRVAGLPTRYVEGFLARPDREVLTGENAHAWAEVYFRGVGWIAFDATGGAAGIAEPAPEAGGADAPDDARQDGTEAPNADGPSTPEPTAAPSPAPEAGAPGDGPTPTPDPTDAPEGGAADTPAPTPDAEPRREPQEPRPEDDGRSGPLVYWLLGILLLVALAALAARWTRARLRRSDPAALCGGAGSAREAAMIVYRANLTLLSHMGQAPAGGETPEAFAKRMAAQFGNGDYAAFVAAAVQSRYGRRPLTREDVERGLRAYVGFGSAMGRREKLRFTLTRVFRGLGDFESIP